MKTQKKIKYLLCHGFGFSDAFWKNLTPLLDDEYEFFSEEKSVGYQLLSTKLNYVGIGHSIGFQKLNNSGINFKALIGLQGFLNFCGNEPNQRTLLTKNLSKMIFAFSKNKTKALYFFHQLCGVKHPSPPDLPLKCLLQDLHSMKISYKHCGCPTLIIATNEDPIISQSILADNFEKTPQVTVDLVTGKHHLLGFLRPDEVAKQTKNFLNTFEANFI